MGKEERLAQAFAQIREERLTRLSIEGESLDTDAEIITDGILPVPIYEFKGHHRSPKKPSHRGLRLSSKS